MYEICPLSIPGCCEIRPTVRIDERGVFVKTFQASSFAALGLAVEFVEQYFSTSKQGVLRGMHFQTPPHDHDKWVYCIDGVVLDAVVDLRVGSPTYQQWEAIELSGERANGLYVPRGVAHGFYVPVESATLVYNVTSEYAPQFDRGIRWDSVRIPWPSAKPLVSVRDASFPELASFESPFQFFPQS